MEINTYRMSRCKMNAIEFMKCAATFSDAKRLNIDFCLLLNGYYYYYYFYECIIVVSRDGETANNEVNFNNMKFNEPTSLALCANDNLGICMRELYTHTHLHLLTSF